MDVSSPKQKRGKPKMSMTPLELQCGLSLISLPLNSSLSVSAAYFAKLRGWMHQCLVIHRSPQKFTDWLGETQCNPQEEVIIGLLKACCSNNYDKFIRNEWGRVNVISPEEPLTTKLLAVVVSKVVRRNERMFYFALKLALLLASRTYFHSSWLLFNACLKGGRGKSFKTLGIQLLNLTLRTKTSFISENIFSILRAVYKCGFQLNELHSLLRRSNQFQSCIVNMRKMAQQQRLNVTQFEQIKVMLDGVCGALQIDVFEYRIIQRKVKQDLQKIIASPKHPQATSLIQRISLSRTCTLEQIQSLNTESHMQFFTDLQPIIQGWVTEGDDKAICGILHVLLKAKSMNGDQVADIMVIGFQSMEAIETVAHLLNTHCVQTSTVRDNLHKKLKKHSAILSLFFQ